MRKRVVFSILGLFLALASANAHAFFGLPGLTGGYPEVEVANGVVSLPMADFSDGQAHFYKHAAGGKDISFFVVKSADGVIRAAFDACDVCYPEKKGYEQDGDFMVCKNCGRRFHSNQINVVQGGCNPSPLARTEEGGNVLIKVSDIEAGASYF